MTYSFNPLPLAVVGRQSSVVLTRTRPPVAAGLLSDGMDPKPLGDSRGDQPQQRIAETANHDPQHGKPEAERDSAIRGTNRADKLSDVTRLAAVN